jgi:ubiquinone/menaquinone biosynthesis C-methylase UbiE
MDKLNMETILPRFLMASGCGLPPPIMSKSMKKWYEELFTSFAESYDREAFTQGTAGECDFIEQEIAFDRSVSILDIGCGTGRHAIELALRGYRVTGVDLSPTQLDRARAKAAAAGVDVTFHVADARALTFADEFGLVLILCEGGFSLMETDEMNYRILEGAARALQCGGKLILTALNALFPLRKAPQDGTPAGDFDLMTFRVRSEVTVQDDSGAKKTLACDERFFAPTEIRWWLHSAGFGEVAIHGCRLGAFSRKQALTPDDFELLAVGVKGRLPAPKF